VYVDGAPLLTRAALTGEVTAAQGSNATILAATAITNRSVIAIDRAADYILFYDASGAVLGKALASTMDLVNDTTPQLSGTLDGQANIVQNLNRMEIDGLSATYTAVPPAFILIGDNHTYDYASLTIPSAVLFTGTHSLRQSGFGFGMGALFDATATFKNDTAVAANIAAFFGMRCSMTYQADNAAITANGIVDFLSSPIFSRTGFATLSSSDIAGFQASHNVGVGCIITQRIGFRAMGGQNTGTLSAYCAFNSIIGATGTSRTDYLAGTNTVPSGIFHIYQANAEVNRWNGGQRWKTTTSGATSITLTAAANHYLFTTSTAVVNINLPDATTCEGLEIVFKKRGAGVNANNLTSTGGQTFDGAAGPLAVTVQNNIARIISDGSNWQILQTGAP
jgi:hypothetical protein